jgi:hypothetical protein
LCIWKNPINKQKIFLSISIVINVVGELAFFPFPDVDIKLFGVARHRFFLFHSAIIPYVFSHIAERIARADIPKIILYSLRGSFSTAVDAHLFIDIFQSKSVHFLVVSTLV